MSRQLYDFEKLRKKNKDVPQIRRACELEVVLVNGKPHVYVREKLKADAERIDREEMTKRGLVVRLNDFLKSDGVKVAHRKLSSRRHDQLKTEVEPHLLLSEVADFWDGVGPLSLEDYDDDVCVCIGGPVERSLPITNL